MIEDYSAVQKFTLDSRFYNDCSVLLERNEISYLLHRNAEVKWIILVPHTPHTELYQLDAALQSLLLEQINRVSAFIKQTWPIDKINVATIGNVVSQLHMHVIGRTINDAYWPGVVWGRSFDKTYTQLQERDIQHQLQSFLEE